MRFIPLCTVGCLAISSASLLSAQTPMLRLGARVRVVFEADSLRRTSYLAGSLTRLRRDTVVLSNGLVPLPPVLLTAGRHLELSVGRSGHTLEGAGIGALLGAVAGALAADLTYEPPECNSDPNNSLGCFDVFGKSGTVVGGALLGLLGGVVVGAMIGQNIGAERWIAAPSVEVGMLPTRSGVAVLAGLVSF